VSFRYLIQLLASIFDAGVLGCMLLRIILRIAEQEWMGRWEKFSWAELGVM
jgi:hypothetical protein